MPVGDQVHLVSQSGGVTIAAVSPPVAPGEPAASRLYLSTDAQHWRDVTVSQVRDDPGDPIYGHASFLDPLHGWVTAWDAGTDRVGIYRTINGGMTWTAVGGSSHGAHAGADTFIQFLSQTVGYLESEDPAGPVLGLAASRDGGLSWEAIAGRDSPDATRLRLLYPIVFANDSDAAVADEAFGCGEGATPTQPSPIAQYSTDIGRTWHDSVLIGIPTDPAPLVCPSGPPVFTGMTPAGTLVVGLVSASGTRLAVLATSDAGAHWRLSSQAPPSFGPRPPGADEVPVGGPDPSGRAGPDGTVWGVGTLMSGQPEVVISTDGGRSWEIRAARGLPAGVPVSLVPRSETTAWAAAQIGPNQRLFVTTDGGESWSPVDPSASS